MDQTILFARSNEIYESKSAAIEKLNTLVKFKYGMPAVVRYNSSDAGDPNVILAVGITTNPEGEIGENAYRIVSDSKQSDVQDSLDKYNSTLEDVTVTENIGGIKKGTSVNDLKGKTITELFDDLLFPTIIPSADTSTAVTLSSSKTGLVEVGTTVSPALTATYNTGAENSGTVYLLLVPDDIASDSPTLKNSYLVALPLYLYDVLDPFNFQNPVLYVAVNAGLTVVPTSTNPVLLDDNVTAVEVSAEGIIVGNNKSSNSSVIVFPFRSFTEVPFLIPPMFSVTVTSSSVELYLSRES
jgi:hypothetical protein